MFNMLLIANSFFLTSESKLISFRSEGDKLERCQEMGIAVVTYQWLVDIYLGIKNAVNENEICSPIPGIVSDTNATPYNIEHYSEACKQFLCLFFDLECTFSLNSVSDLHFVGIF